MDNSQPASREYSYPAGFWIRLWADIIDSIIVYFPCAVLGNFITALLGPHWTIALLNTAVGVAIGGVYYTVLTGKSGQTWGKKVFDLKVALDDGGPLTYYTAFLRWCAYLPSYLTMGVGFMLAGWNKDKKALHDYIVGTRVVRKSAGNDAQTTWKIVGIVTAVSLALLALAVAAAVSLFKKNGEGLRAQGKSIEAEARTFAQTTDQAGCVNEALTRSTGAGILGQVRSAIFLSGCLPAARPSENFCQGVPPDDSIMATVAWRLQTCEKLGHQSNQACGNLLGAVQRHCAKPGAQGPPDGIKRP